MRRLTQRTTIATGLAVLAAGASASPAAADRIYGGESASERLQVALTVSEDGLTLRGAALISELRCRSYQRVDTGTTTTVPALPAEPERGVLYLTDTAIAAGRLHASLLIARTRDGGRTDVARGRLTGALTASRGRGTLELTSRTVEDATGRVLRTCSRTLRWRAVRNPGRLYAGNTSQGAPVILRLSADRRRVTSSMIGWFATCRRVEYYFEPHDEFLLPFRLGTRGAFEQPYRYDAGRGVDVVARFAGRFTSTTATGTFRGRVRGGGERCDTGSRTWSAATG